MYFFKTNCKSDNQKLLSWRCSESEPLNLVKNSLHDNTLPWRCGVESAKDRVILSIVTLLCLWPYFWQWCPR